MKKFKTPDLNAPRYRAKTTTLLNKKVYNEFIKKYPKHSDISVKDFKKIINHFNNYIINIDLKNLRKKKKKNNLMIIMNLI